MSEKKRNSFSSKFKAKVALEAIRGEKTLNEIAKEYGVHPTQVGQDPAVDPEKLYTEIGRLKVELDWLKKKAGPYL
jgi:transposase